MKEEYERGGPTPCGDHGMDTPTGPVRPGGRTAAI